MLWFKHDCDASADAKIKKVILKYGAEGYAIYFHCIELIVSNISESNITFVLEHDSEIIADNLKIKGTPEKSGIELVNEIMRFIITLGLFEEYNGHVTCFQLLKRFDLSMTSSVKMRALIADARKNHDSIMTNPDDAVMNPDDAVMNSDFIMQEKNRIDKKRVEVEEKEEEKIPPVFFKPLIPANDGTARIAKAQHLWNAFGFKPVSKISVLQFKQEDRSACLAIIQAYPEEDIFTALSNYQKVLESSDHDFPYRYQSFVGFMKSGVEKFVKDSDPWNVFRKKEEEKKIALPDDFSEYEHLTAKET